MSNLRLSILVIMILNIVGCFGEPSYPDWFMKTPRDTQRYLYGMREGKTKDEAIVNALNEIASKIHISIESSSSVNINITTSNNHEDYLAQRNQVTKNYIDKIEFSNYKVKKEKKVSDNKYVVLVQVDKALNAKLMLKKIDLDIQKYQQLLSSTDKNPINKIKAYNKALKEIDKDIVNCSVISKLAPDIDTKERVSKLLDIKNKMEKYKSSITFSISGTADEAYKNIIAKEVAKRGFRVSTTGQSPINISIDAKEKKIKVLGYRILKSKVKIVIKSNGDIIGETYFTIGSKSYSGNKQAHEFLLRNFEKRLKKKRVIEKLLGI